MTTTTPPAYSKSCRRYYRVTATGAWRFVNTWQARLEHMAARAEQYAFAMLVGLGVALVLDEQRRAPHVKCARIAALYADDRPVRQGPTARARRELTQADLLGLS